MIFFRFILKMTSRKDIFFPLSQNTTKQF